MRYLDPKADLTFKKIFGEHKDLLISLLNALLPLADDEQIADRECGVSLARTCARHLCRQEQYSRCEMPRREEPSVYC